MTIQVAMFGSVPVISRGQGSPSSSSTPALASHSSLLMAGGQRPVVSNQGLDSMAAMTRAVTNLIIPGYNTTNMTNTPSLNPQTQPQQPLQFGSTSKQLFSPGFNNTVNNAKGQEASHPGQGLVFSQAVSVLQHLPEGDKTSALQLGVSNQTSPGQARIISLTVTDPSDYFFYFSLTLTENDFNILRQGQGLLVDFGNFSNMLGIINVIP